MAFVPELNRPGFGRGSPTADYSYSPGTLLNTPESKIVFPPIPDYEDSEHRRGRKGEEKLARAIASLQDVVQIVIYPKFSIEDISGIDMTVYFTQESDQVPVDIQNKCGWYGYMEYLARVKAELVREHSQMSTQQYLVNERRMVLVSSRSEEKIIKDFRRENAKIQAAVLLERARNELIPVFAA